MPQCWPWAQPPPCNSCNLPECSDYPGGRANASSAVRLESTFEKPRLMRSLNVLMRVSSRLAVYAAAESRAGRGAMAEIAMASWVRRKELDGAGWAMSELDNSGGLLATLAIPLTECQRSRIDWATCGAAACVVRESAPLDSLGRDASFDERDRRGRGVSRPQCPPSAIYHPAKICEWSYHSDGSNLAPPKNKTASSTWDEERLGVPAPPQDIGMSGGGIRPNEAADWCMLDYCLELSSTMTLICLISLSIGGVAASLLLLFCVFRAGSRVLAKARGVSRLPAAGLVADPFDLAPTAHSSTAVSADAHKTSSLPRTIFADAPSGRLPGLLSVSTSRNLSPGRRQSRSPKKGPSYRAFAL